MKPSETVMQAAIKAAYTNITINSDNDILSNPNEFEEAIEFAVQAAIEAHEEEKWQDIENCPHNQTVDLWHKEHGRLADYMLAVYDGVLWAHYSVPEGSDETLFQQFHVSEISHFMLLPQPPKETK